MGHFVGASDIVDLCGEVGLESEKAAMLDALNKAATALADKFGVSLVSIENQPGTGGLFACFEQAYVGQQCPNQLAWRDITSPWALGHGSLRAANDDRSQQLA